MDKEDNDETPNDDISSHVPLWSVMSATKWKH